MHAILQGHNESNKDGALGTDSKSPIWSWQVLSYDNQRKYTENVWSIMILDYKKF